MNYGFVRVAAITPKVRVADVQYNVSQILEKVEECKAKGVQIAVFPELCLCGYTCSDLFFQPALQRACADGVKEIAAAVRGSKILLFVGLPLVYNGKLYNVAAAVQDGKILAYVPKTNLPNYDEFYEARHFVSAKQLPQSCTVDGVPFGRNILFRCAGFEELTVGCEICEDLWVIDSPSDVLAKNGATVIVNLSASDEVIGKDEYRRTLLKAQSGKCLCGYVYASAGMGESTTDCLFAGQNLIAENGAILAENKPFAEENVLISEIDVEKLSFERKKISTFVSENADLRILSFETEEWQGELIRTFPQYPFVPSDSGELKDRSQRILATQANALARRLRHTGSAKAVLGISGGLDSTLALLVAVRAFDLLGKDRKDIIAITMPGFGTTGRTYRNALRLISEVGATAREIPISESVLQHFKDIGQDPSNHNTTYENAQARTRTLILMDVANQEGGLVVGTGDLSELALGWCTYNGDHMSMYGVNASVPKTLVKYLVAAVGEQAGGTLQAVLQDILSTEISPELLPPDASGKISQKTEDLIGPYELHDFYLYHIIRWGCSPQKVLYLAKHAFRGKYSETTLVKWLKNFYKRFFAQQFKRSCMPDGVKIGSVSLSPRADWRMPSDACATLWLKEVEEWTK